MSSEESWALVAVINTITFTIAAGAYFQDKADDMPRWLTAPWEHIVRIMEKPFRRKKPVYEPAGIIHYGEFWFGNYYAQATPHRTYHVWDGNTYIGEYAGERIDVVLQLHQRNQG